MSLKQLNFFSKLDPSINFFLQKPKYTTIPLIAVPTTAGTGSEDTRYALIYENGEYRALALASIFPNIAIIDADFLNKLPLYYRHATLLDAFCQALEGYCALRSNEDAKRYSEKSLMLILPAFNHYLRDHPFIYGYVMRAARYAGQAINISGTTASHAMSYKLTSLTGIAHGHAVSLTLPHVLEYMINHLEGNKELEKTLTDPAKLFEVNLENLVVKVKMIINEFGLETPKITKAQLSELVESVNIERLKNTPVQLDKAAILEIYQKSFSLV